MTPVAAQWLAGLLGVGGAGVLVSGRAELQRRWASWIVLSVALAVAYALPPYGPVLLAGGCVLGCAHDYARLGGRVAYGLAWLAPSAGFVLLGAAALPLAVAALGADVAARWVRRPLGGTASVAVSAVVGTLTLAGLGVLGWPWVLTAVAGPPLGALARRATAVGPGLLHRLSPVLATFALALVLGLGKVAFAS